MDHTFKAVKLELDLARAEEAEALRRAYHLRSRGASWDDVRSALRDAEGRHLRVTQLELELRGLRELA